MVILHEENGGRKTKKYTNCSLEDRGNFQRENVYEAKDYNLWSKFSRSGIPHVKIGRGECCRNRDVRISTGNRTNYLVYADKAEYSKT